MEQYIPSEQLNSLFIECVFEGGLELMDKPEVQYIAGLSECFFYSVDTERNMISIQVSSAFERYLYHTENVAERALVSVMVQSVSEYFSLEFSDTDIENSVAQIVPNTMARQGHAFEVKDFRDHFAHILPKRLQDNKIDEARAMAHLGWKVRDRSEGNQIIGKPECTQYLNKTCQYVLAKLCSSLAKYDRKSFLRKCILNYEAAMIDRYRWRRTAGAVINLRKDKAAAEAVISQNEHEINRLLTGLRVLIEMAICECPLGGGVECGDLDLSRLASQAMSVVVIGGFSDTIHWRAVPPEVYITALGDVQIDFTFYNQVMEPYVLSGTSITIKDEVKKYKTHTEGQTQALPFAEVFEPEFLDAIEEHFGFSAEGFRAFVEEIENEGVRTSSPLLELQESEIMKLCKKIDSLSSQTVSQIFTQISLWPRNNWKEIPAGFSTTDIHPWKFRRQLSILRRPLFKLDDSDDPTYLVSPGMLREAFYYQMRNYHDGSFPKRQLKPGKMRKWKAFVDGRSGDALEGEVVDRFLDLGWKARRGVKLTEIFGKKLDRDYGEIDVLAWSEKDGRILIIECKDVKYKKTPGEIAEQLSDFLGVENEKGKPDLLLKHLRRVGKLQENSEQLAKFLKFQNAPKIEALMLFRNPVPMMFAWKTITSDSEICTLSGLETLLNTTANHQ